MNQTHPVVVDKVVDPFTFARPSPVSMSFRSTPFADLSLSELVDRLKAKRVSLGRYWEDVEQKRKQTQYGRAIACVSASTDSTEPSGRLAGAPFIVSSSLNVAGLPTTLNTPALASNVPEFDAGVVRSLQEEGGVVFGKSLGSELGISSHGDGVVNPHTNTGVSGGACGGAAAAVAARVVPFGIGVDVKGDCRVPASLCGVAAFRPSIGRYPVDEAFVASHTTGTPSIIARSVEDLQLLDTILSAPVPRRGPTAKQKEAAAVKIQAIARGRRDRRRVRAIHEERVAADLDAEANAASRIQAIARGRRDRARTAEIRAKKEEERAVVRIQAVARGRMVRDGKTPSSGAGGDSKHAEDGDVDSKFDEDGEEKMGESFITGTDLDEEEKAATAIQNLARQRAAKARTAQLRAIKEEEDAAKRIQAVARGRKDRARVAMMKGATDARGAVSLDGLRVGVLRGEFTEGLDPAVAAVFAATLKRLAAAGAELVDVTLSVDQETVSTAADTIQTYETVRQLASYLFQSNGLDRSVSVSQVLDEARTPAKSALLEQLDSTTAITGEEYREAVSVLRPMVQRALDDAFMDGSLAVLVYPTTPLPARKVSGPGGSTVLLNGVAADSRSLYSRNAALAAVAGVPSATIPTGMTEPVAGADGLGIMPPSPRCPVPMAPLKPSNVGAERLPVGLEITGSLGADEDVLAIASAMSSLAPRIPDPLARNQWRVGVNKF